MNQTKLNRRDFLKTGALICAGAILLSRPVLSEAASRPAELAARGLTLRATRDNEIHLSRDGGQSWQMSNRFGKEFTVTRLYQDSAQRIRAQISFSGHSFELVLDEKKECWRTV
jgi:hypothetical protein